MKYSSSCNTSNIFSIAKRTKGGRINTEESAFDEKEDYTGTEMGFERSKERVYKCIHSGCSKVYYSLYRLKIHLRVHEGAKPFKCTECGKCFNEKGNLKTHILIHTGDKPYECTVTNCGKRFRTYGHLKDHMSTHFDLRFFECKICGLAFSRKWTLKKHMYTHTGEKPFSCQICHKKFSDKSNLSTHFKKHKNTDNYENMTYFSAAQFSIIEDKKKTEEKEAPSHPETHSTYNFSANDLHLIEDDFVIRPSCFKPNFPHFEEKNILQNSVENKEMQFEHCDDLHNFKIVDFEKDNLEADRILFELFIGNDS